MGKAYEIEIVFATGGVRVVEHEFKTQKAARAWCADHGMTPIFGGKRPSMFWSGKDRYGWHGMQATIREAGSVFWLDSSTEGRAARKIKW